MIRFIEFVCVNRTKQSHTS